MEPDSLCAAIGLRDDDIVIDVDGLSIDTLEDAMRAHTGLANAASITVHIERSGKRNAMTYSIL